MWQQRRQALQQRWLGLSDHNQVGVCLAGVGGVLALWAVFWPVPTEVSGQGVFLYPDNAGVLNARSGGQVLDVGVKVGEPVRKGRPPCSPPRASAIHRGAVGPPG